MLETDVRSARILLVDDQQDNVDVLHDFLEMQGYQNIQSTTDSRDVQRLMKEFKPDIILLDLSMPYLSGFDIMEQLESIVDPSDYLPILVITADVTLETKRKALLSGASDFLTKPFDLIELQARVNSQLQIKFKNEQINKYAKELEHLIATKDKFFSIIAHDLRNPFVGIENFTAILIKLGNYNLADIESQLQTIHSTARDGHELLENLLKWSKSQTGALKIELDVFRLLDPVKKCMSLILTQADTKKITLVSDVSADILIESDQDVVETILRNLLSNAVKFTPASGTITVRAFVQENTIEISITDTGVGIPAELIDKLFRIDSKLQSQKGTDDESGSGLGLILCKEFIDKLGGTIWAESEVGKGTSIKFRLPHTIDKNL